MRDRTSNGPVRSIWSIPSNTRDPISRCVSFGIMAVSLMRVGLDSATMRRHLLAVMPKDPQIPPNSRAIEMVAFPAVQLLDVSGPLQVFATANEMIAKDGGPPPYTVRVVARHAR